jgi:hypothetical protein
VTQPNSTIDTLHEQVQEVPNVALAQLSSSLEVDLLQYEATTPQVEISYTTDIPSRRSIAGNQIAPHIMDLTVQPPNTVWAGVPHSGLGPSHCYNVPIGRPEKLTAVSEGLSWVTVPAGAWLDDDYVREQAPIEANAYWYTGATIYGTRPHQLRPDKLPKHFFPQPRTVVEAGEVRYLGGRELVGMHEAKAVIDELVCVFHGVQYFMAEVRHDYDDERQEALRKLVACTMRADWMDTRDQMLRQAIKEGERVGIDTLPFVPCLEEELSQAGALGDVGLRRRRFDLIEEAMAVANEAWHERYQTGEPAKPAMGGTYGAIMRHATVVDSTRAVELARQIASPGSRVTALTKLAALESDRSLLDEAQTIVHNEYKIPTRYNVLRSMFLTLYRQGSDLAPNIYEQLSPLVKLRLQRQYEGISQS